MKKPHSSRSLPLACATKMTSSETLGDKQINYYRNKPTSATSIIGHPRISVGCMKRR